MNNSVEGERNALREERDNILRELNRIKLKQSEFCWLTKAEAYSVAELIDGCLIDEVRNNTEWDSMQALRNIIHAYEKMCQASGYVGLTEEEQEENSLYSDF